jgi:hypothetical protein
MGKNRSASGLTNVIQYDNNGNIAFVSGSTTLMQVSSSGAITTTGTISGGAAADALLLNGTGSLAFVTTASYNVASASFSSRTTQVERTYATTGSNTFTGAQFASDTSNAISFTSTASLYSDGGLRVQGNSFVSGTAYFNNIVVYGTSSIQYITSSQVNVGTNIITVNTDTPAVRFGGLAVFDSGSTQLTGSILWDSEKNHWVYSNPSGSSYSGGMLISGPRSSALGSEQGTTACMLLVGQGSDHLTSSMIYHDSNRTCFYGNALVVSGSNNVGIGDVPSSAYKLYVNGSSAGGGLLLYSGNSCSNYPLVVGDYATNTYFHVNGVGTVYSRCNVGIGTVTPTGGISGTETALEISNSNVGVLALTSTAASGKKYQIYSSNDGGLFFRDGTCSAQRIMISTIGNFGVGSTSPVAKLHTCTAYNANNIQAVFGNSNGSINSQVYDTVVIQQDDVTTLKLVERNVGSVDQVLTLSVGDSSTRISTTCSNPLQFFVGGTPSGCGYNGLSGTNALSIASSGTSTFNYPVIMANIGHYTNYRSTSGCFAIFCASQGAILYVTSMHNNGRSTAIVTYANGVVGGAAVTVANQVTPYGPASMGFGVCANGWVYGYQQYGGPTDYYAINMNGTFTWAF